MRTSARIILTLSAPLLLVASLAGCSSGTSAASGAGTSESAPTTTSSESMRPSGASAPAGMWDVPRDVQVAYYKAICTGSGAKLGIGGTFDDAAETCTAPDGSVTDASSGVLNLLASDAEQMRQSTQFMVTQVGVPVEGCPTPEEYNTSVDLTISNDCVIAAMKAVTTYMSN